MKHLLLPTYTCRSIYDISPEQLVQAGIRGVIFDIDNTLVPHGVDADKRAIELFARLKSIGYDICLLSNNKKARVKRFNKDVNVKYIFKAQKPYSRNYYAAAMKMHISVKSVLCVGDQLFTDIFGAKRIGMKNYLVSPINKREEIQIVIKRKLENVVLSEYRAKRKAKKEQREIEREARQQEKHRR
jgi:HAD superfamily phosphatase (TIGR01668 family)